MERKKMFYEIVYWVMFVAWVIMSSIFAHGYLSLGVFSIYGIEGILIGFCLILCLSFHFILFSKRFSRDDKDDIEYKANYFILLIITIITVLVFVTHSLEEIDSESYNNYIPKEYIQSELDDDKITNFEAFIILHKYNKKSLEFDEKIKKDEKDREEEAKRLAKEKLKQSLNTLEK